MNTMRCSFSLLLVSALLLLATCSDKTPTGSSGGSAYVLRYPDESTAMALIASRQLRAPQELVESIDRDLARIRDRFGEEHPIVMQPFWKPWDTYRISITVDPSIKYGTDTTAVALLDSILSANDAVIDSTFSAITSERPWYPPAAVMLLAGRPGVGHLWTDGTFIADWYVSISRIDDGDHITYYFGSDNCGNYVDFLRFEVRHGRVEFVDQFKPCHPLLDLHWWEPGFVFPDDFGWIAQAWADSVLAVRQPWVDTADAANYHLCYDHVVNWVRP